VGGDLVGKRVLITGLTGRKDLNGQCGLVLLYDSASGRCTVRTEEVPGETVALRPINLDIGGARPIPIPKAQPKGGASSVAEAARQMEDPERTAAYLKAANWKKPAEPGSIEAFYKAQNRQRRQEEDAKIARWRAANPKEAARLDESKERARQAYGYNSFRVNRDRLADDPPTKEEEEDDEEDEPPPEAAAKATRAPETSPELAKALAALSAAKAAPARSAPLDGDLLTSVLGKIGAPAPPTGPGGLPMPPPPPAAAGPSPSAADLLAAALGKAGVAPEASAGERARAGLRTNADPSAHTASSALDAYKRRHMQDGGAPAGDLGTVGADLRLKMEQAAARRAESKYRDKHAFVGEHYNDI
jgi:hypothetical protein